MVVMSNGAGPMALRIANPTIAKAVKKTNLEIGTFQKQDQNENITDVNKKKKMVAPHDHDLLECGACQEVPQSVQCGCRHNLRNLKHHYQYNISCRT